MKTEIYFAHPITNKGSEIEDFNDLIAYLEGTGHKIVKPKTRNSNDKWSFDAIKALDKADCLIADISEASHGVGFEIGYFFAKAKKIIIVAKENSKRQVSRFFLNLFPGIIFYKNYDDLKRIENLI